MVLDKIKQKIYSIRWHLWGVVLFVGDILSISAAYFLALYIGFKCQFSEIPPHFLDASLKSMPWHLILCFLVYWRFKFYSGVWQYVSLRELFRYVYVMCATIPGYFILCKILQLNLPRRYFVIGGLLQLIFLILSRFSYRILIYIYLDVLSLKSSRKRRINCMLIGAGEAGYLILQDILRFPDNRLKVRCIIDDNPSKRSNHILGVPVVGGRNDILKNVKKYGIQEILFTIPTISLEEKKNILSICQETGCKLKILPGLYQLVQGDVSLAKMKDVAVEDLLGRDPVKVSTDEILENLKGKVVLVTGGGGSIGSELCRQIALHEPSLLIIFDIYENNAYDIQQELRRTCPCLNLAVLIGSVRDTKRIMKIFEDYKPEIVFHAAAHKHVPLMEDSPCEAIKNNVLGTYKTAFAAMKNGCRRFVLISTDKAVNPTNIMGASKRLCEMVIQVMNEISHSGNYDLLPHYLSHHDIESAEKKDNLRETTSGQTEFVAVRFGNVLGSNGSVIPLFRKQIENGGPVTVTHPDIIRYFMTIPEAVSLVLQAATYAKGGEIFVLDMGEPVKIDTLARNLIKLSGFKPDIDIKIEYTGLRPGEKLYEEKLMSEEGLLKTPNKLIHIAKPLKWDIKAFLDDLYKLTQVSYQNESTICDLVAQMVPTYKNNKINSLK